MKFCLLENGVVTGIVDVEDHDSVTGTGQNVAASEWREESRIDRFFLRDIQNGGFTGSLAKGPDIPDSHLPEKFYLYYYKNSGNTLDGNRPNYHTVLRYLTFLFLTLQDLQ